MGQGVALEVLVTIGAQREKFICEASFDLIGLVLLLGGVGLRTLLLAISIQIERRILEQHHAEPIARVMLLLFLCLWTLTNAISGRRGLFLFASPSDRRHDVVNYFKDALLGLSNCDFRTCCIKLGC